MPWSITRDGSKYCVTKEGDDSPLKCYDSRTDAIKYQRALYANESRDSMVAAITYEEPAPEDNVKDRLDQALARLDSLAERGENEPGFKITMASNPQMTETLLALTATINQISERLENGERVSESLLASLQSMAVQQPPVVNVEAPIVNVPETVIHVPAPVVNVEAPVVNIPETVVNVPAPIVNVSVPEREKKVTFLRDPFGRLEGAEIGE